MSSSQLQVVVLLKETEIYKKGYCRNYKESKEWIFLFIMDSSELFITKGLEIGIFCFWVATSNLKISLHAGMASTGNYIATRYLTESFQEYTEE